MERLILFGGTFDPIHNGHLRIARFASLKLNADVIFIPAKSPRWKEPSASISDRLAMLKIALKKEGSGSFFISDYEINSKEEINYTIDTIKYFKNKYKNRELYLLIGLDQVEKFNEWKNAEEISKLTNIIFVSRPGIISNSKNITKYKMTSLVYEGSGRVSSNAVRNLKSLDIPYDVLKYIENNNLYFIKLLKEKYYKEKRFMHALSVANLSFMIAINNKRDDANECYIAGLLHDIGKKVEEKEMRAIMIKEFKEYYKVMPINLYHQFVGAYIAKTKLDITDEVVLDAIMFHASGKENMPPVSKIVYSADKIDPLRGYNSNKLIKECYKNYYVGFIKVLKENKRYLISKQLDMNNPLTKACMDLYLNKEAGE